MALTSPEQETKIFSKTDISLSSVDAADRVARSAC